MHNIRQTLVIHIIIVLTNKNTKLGAAIGFYPILTCLFLILVLSFLCYKFPSNELEKHYQTRHLERI